MVQCQVQKTIFYCFNCSAPLSGQNVLHRDSHTLYYTQRISVARVCHTKIQFLAAHNTSICASFAQRLVKLTLKIRIIFRFFSSMLLLLLLLCANDIVGKCWLGWSTNTALRKNTHSNMYSDNNSNNELRQLDCKLIRLWRLELGTRSMQKVVYISITFNLCLCHAHT